MIKIEALGGYSKIGKNMTAINIDGEVIITDMGADMERLVDFQEDSKVLTVKDSEKLIEGGVIPDDRDFFEKEGMKVKAIVIGHGHLDHIWAVPFLAAKYKCPIITTLFTSKILAHLMSDYNSFNLKIVRLVEGSIFKVSDKLSIELVHITHSIPSSTLIVIHSPYGAVIYANDWKFDNYPTLGKKPNYERLEELSKKGIAAVISDSTRIDFDGYSFSESVAKTMLEDVIRKSLKHKTIFVTTFSSHIARIKNIVEVAKRFDRQVMIFGRSMDLYIESAISANVVDKKTFPKVSKVFPLVNRALKVVNDNPGKYLVICTGHQGEPNSFLKRLAGEEYSYRLSSEDAIIFSSETIPTPVNVANKGMLKKELSEKGAYIVENVHVSGHAYKNDHRNFIKMLMPKHYIPSHGGIDKISEGITLSKEFGYELGKTSHILLDNQELELNL